MEFEFKPTSLKQAAFLQSNAYITVFGGSAGCYTASAEYLSPTGWNKISEYDGGLVGQYNHNTGNVELVNPSEYIKKPCNKFYRMKARGLDFIFTPEHRVPYFNDHDKNKIKVISYQEVMDRHIKSLTKGWTGSIKTTFSVDREGFKLNGELVKDDMLRLLVAIQADGSINRGRATYIRFSKERKDIRLKTILENLGIQYSRKIETSERYTSKTHFEYKFYLDYRTKIFDYNWYSCNQHQIEVIMSEFGYWDGSFVKNDNHTTVRYSCNFKQNIDFLQYVAHACGYNTSIVEDKRYDKYKQTGQHWTLNCTKQGSGFRRFANKDGKCEVTEYPSEDGYKYCFVVPSSFLVIRQNNKIFISGNSGKTYQSLLRFLRWVDDPNFVGYVIRKNASDLKGSGGAFDLACKMFKAYDKRVRITKQPMRITFPHPEDSRVDGASIFFTGLDGQSGQDSLQGKEISAAMLDEATHLTEDDIWWVSSRLRTNAKMQPNMWLTCNPDPDSPIAKWIDPYLYPKGTIVDGQLVEGRPDPEKNGLIRYFVKLGDDTVWADSLEEIVQQHPELKDHTGKWISEPTTFKFIGATCKDNPKMLEANPRYEINLQNMPRLKRERLLYGNWYAREEESGYFKREWTTVIDKMPDDVVRRVRCWDLASSIPCEAYPNPDWTVGVLLAKTKSGFYIVEDVQRFRKRAGENIQEIIRIAKEDNSLYGRVEVYLPEDPSAGKAARVYHAKEFTKVGLVVRFIKVLASKSKLQRFEPFSASAENGLVMVLKADWNDTYFSELEAFDGSRRSKRKDD